MTLSPAAESRGSATGRHIALFPGAFRPPHINHFSAVETLALREDVDEVVVIIANRARLIPGTAKVLDVDVAVRVWSIYLRELPKVRVEVAPHSATAYALDCARRASIPTYFSLVVGRKDYQDRHRRLLAASEALTQPGVRLTIVEDRTEVIPVTATHLRSLVAQGARGHDEFVRGLPRHLDCRERSEVWRLCSALTSTQDEVVSRTIMSVVADRGFSPPVRIDPVTQGKPHGVQRLTFADGVEAFVKSANDAVADPAGTKPRRRIKAEKAAVKWARRNLGTDVALPDPIWFDKPTRTLAQAPVCPGGETLEQAFLRGEFNVAWIRAAMTFLAQAHFCPITPEPFWDDPVRDLHRWTTALDKLTINLSGNDSSQRSEQHLLALRRCSQSTRSVGFRHLDFTPANIRGDGRCVGIIDFESCAATGDPAFDVGTLIGHTIHAGLRASAVSNSLTAARAGLEAYRDVAGEELPNGRSLVVGFTGAKLLELAYESGDHRAQHCALALLEETCREQSGSVMEAIEAAVEPHKS